MLVAIYLANNHCNSQRTKHIDTRRHFVCEWGLKTTSSRLSSHLHWNADIFSKNPTEEIFQEHAAKMVKNIPKGTEMCNVTTFPSKDINFEPQQNEWIKAMRRNKRKLKEETNQLHPTQ
jgi:hypothetical protein